MGMCLAVELWTELPSELLLSRRVLWAKEDAS